MEPDIEIVGRESELADLTSRLRDRRLVTIAGPGGIGKTALSRAAAAIVGPGFDYGAVIVDLTRVDRSEGVAEAVAAQLGCADFESLVNSPSDQPALVVFDNCEHVLDAAAEVASRLLESCVMPTILATSRSPLDLPGESVLTLGPLQTPEDDDVASSAVELFLQRAVDIGVAVEDRDRPRVAEISRRLDGVPLALELAAARLRSHSLTEVLAELDQQPHALSRPRFRGKPSHRSVADMVGWSYDLLDESARHTFDCLSVFVGPFTAAMAVAVVDPSDSTVVRRDLDGLVEASLVAADIGGETARYRLLHPIRAVGLDQLTRRGERDVVESRLVDNVVALAMEVILSTTSGWDGSVLVDLLALYDNVAASIRWALDHDDEPDRAFLLVAVSWGIVHQAHTAEIAELSEEVLQRWPDRSQSGWADAAATAATCRNLMGDIDGAIALAEEALAHVGSSPHAPGSLRRVLAQAHRAAGRYEAARDWFAEGVAVARELDSFGMAMELLVDLGLVQAEIGEIDAGSAALEDARSEALERGSRINAAWALAGQGALALRQGHDDALAVINAAIAESEAIGYPAGLSFSFRAKAIAEIESGDDDAAASTLLTLLYELLRRGGLNDLRIVLDPTAMLFRRAGNADWADLAVTAASLPVTSVAVPVEQELAVAADGLGEALAIRDAYVACRDGLQAMISQEVSGDPKTLADNASLSRDGDVWRVEFGDVAVTLKASKGVDDLAVLLAAPGREFACLELAGSTISPGGSEDLVIDERARREYEQRVRDLQAEVDEYEGANDIARADKARLELDLLVDHLAESLGLAGRSRRHTDDAERARSAVTQRLRSTMKRIGEHHPTLGDHLSGAVTTGTFCSYRPQPAVEWTVSR